MDLIRKIGVPAMGTGSGAPPAYATGGVLGDLDGLGDGGGMQDLMTGGLGLGDWVRSAVDRVRDGAGWLARGAIGAVWTPIYGWMRSLIEGLGSSVGEQLTKGPARSLLGAADRWVVRIDDQIPNWAPLQTDVGRRSNQSNFDGSLSAAGAIIPMLNGGVVKGGRGGILALIGEGRSDEAVVPLDNYNFGGGGRTVNIYGDITLPDVTNVDEFLANLESIGS